MSEHWTKFFRPSHTLRLLVMQLIQLIRVLSPCGRHLIAASLACWQSWAASCISSKLIRVGLTKMTYLSPRQWVSLRTVNSYREPGSAQLHVKVSSKAICMGIIWTAAIWCIRACCNCGSGACGPLGLIIMLCACNTTLSRHSYSDELMYLSYMYEWQIWV